MRTLRRILYGLLIFLAIAVIIAILFIRNIGHRGLPDYSGSVDLKGVKEEVMVVRDEYAIPHIYAKNEEDLYASVGYAMAQDRLWQMDLLRRVTLGRLSEIFGDALIETDVLLRALNYSEKSNKILAIMDPDQKKCLEAFCRGVNEYIDGRGKKLPPEFTILGYKPEAWEPVHSLNLIGYMAWDLKEGWSEIILEEVRNKVGDSLYAELLPDIKNEKTHVYPLYTRDSLSLPLGASMLSANDKLAQLGLEVFNGSNNWAVSGKRTSTGKPVLCNDMHLGLDIPGIWYQMHQVVEGQLDVSGLVLPGEPFVVCGHNQHIAWGMTNAFVDNVDFYEEKINPQDSMQYMYQNEWKPIVLKKEIIRIKGGKSVEKEIRFTHRGPVISRFKDLKGKAVTMHWVGHEMSNELRTVYLLNRAKNWNEFCDAIKTFQAISQNIVYADVEGNIGLYYAAGVPVRKRDFSGFFLPGWTDEYDWKGWVSFENLPHSYNPPTGYVSSANNNPVGPDYPYHIGTWYMLPSRIDRIREMIEAKPKLSVEDMKTIQTDQHSVLARSMTKVIVEQLSSCNDLDNDEKLALGIFVKWSDGYMNKDLVAPALFEKFYLNLASGIMKDEMGPEIFKRYFDEGSLVKFAINNIWNNPRSPWWDDISTPQKEGMKDIIRKTMKLTVQYFNNTYGSDTSRWRWGDIHSITLNHPLGKVKILDRVFHLNRGPFRVGGSYHTVAPFSYPFSDAFAVDEGASHRHIFNLANWDESFTVIPTGNAGIPASSNYCDQTPLYINMRYHGETYSTENVKKHEKYKLVLK